MTKKKEYIQKIALTNLRIFLLVGISIISFLMMLNHYQPPVEWDDAARDYVVARHIAVHHEFPLTGHFNAVANIKNSAVYFYALSLFITLYDSFYFLGFVNILLHLLTGIIIYILGNVLFGKNQGLLAFSLFSINLLIFNQTTHIWQPWIMQPIINLSLLFLFIAYKKSDFRALLMSTITFILAGSFHYSGYVLAPVFIVISMLTLIKIPAKKIHYLLQLITALFTILIFYAPVAIYYLSSPANAHNLASFKIDLNPLHILNNLLHNVFYIIYTSLFYDSNSLIVSVGIPIIVISVLFFYLLKLKNNNQIYSNMLLSIIGFFILSASLVNLSQFTLNYYYYFTPVLGAFFVLISHVFITLSKKNYILKSYAVFLGCLYLGMFISTYFANYYIYGKFYNPSQKSPLAEAVLEDIHTIKSQRNINNYNFFTVESLAASHGWIYSASLWMHLEEDLDTRFVQVDEYDIRNIKELNAKDSEYIYLICPSAVTNTFENSKCVNSFVSQRQSYKYRKKIYSNSRHTIFSFVKTNYKDN